MNPDEQDSQIVVPAHDFYDLILGSPNFDSNFGAEGQNSVHNQQHEAMNGPMLGSGSNSPTKETQQDSIGTHVADTQYTSIKAVSSQSAEADAQASIIGQNSLVSRVGDTQFTAIEAMEAETQALHDSPQVSEFLPASQAPTHASIPIGAPVINNGSFIVVNRPEAHVDDLAAGFIWGQAKKHTGDNFSRPPGKKNENDNPKSEPSYVLKQSLALPSNENGMFSIPNLYVC